MALCHRHAFQNVPHRADVLNAQGRVVAEVFAQARNKYIHASGYKEAVVLPDGFEKNVTLDDLVGVAEKQLEHAAFLVGEACRYAARREKKVVNVECGVGDLQHGSPVDGS